MNHYIQYDVLDEDMIQGLWRRQRGLKTESSRLVIDTSNYFKYRGITALEMMEYIMNLTAWIQGCVYQIDENIGCVSICDPTVERDQHIVLVKKENDWSKQMIAGAAETLSHKVTSKQALLLLRAMRNRLRHSQDETIKKIVKQLTKYETNLQNKQEKTTTKIELIKLWLGNVIVGPFALTRDLFNHYFNKVVGYIAGPLIMKMRQEFEDIHDWEIDQLTIIDDTYFVFDHDDITGMKFPSIMDLDFVGIADINRSIDVKSNTVTVKKYKSDYVKGMEQSDETKCDFLVKKYHNKRNYFMSLEYGDDVFQSVDETMLNIFQTMTFVDWCQDTANLELWFGYGDRRKINDYEKYRKMYNLLQDRVNELESELEAEKATVRNDKEEAD